MAKKKKILIIEDDSFVVKVFLERLQDEGFEVAVATNGEEGLRMTRAEKPDLVLLDLILPQMNGFDYLRKVKKDSQSRKIPVLILSNLGQDEDVSLGKKLGAVDYLVKTSHPLRSVVEKIKKYI